MPSYHAFLGCSVDGYIAGPAGELDWLTVFENTGFDEFFGSVDALAMGRVTYGVMREADPDYYRGLPVHVLSTTLPTGPQPDLGRSVVQVHPSVDALRQALLDARLDRVYVDGGRTVQTFIAAGLLFDLTITRVPVLLGDGIALFGPLPETRRVRLAGSVVTDQGAVQTVYEFPTPTAESRIA